MLPSEVTSVTPAKPVYVKVSWAWAENLAVGDRLCQTDGGWDKVLAVERVRLASVTWLFRIEPENKFQLTGFSLSLLMLQYSYTVIEEVGSMFAIEFRAKVKDGLIEIPPEHRDKLKNEVRVIILTKDTEPHSNMIERLLSAPLRLKGFKPLSRTEIYGRN